MKENRPRIPPRSRVASPFEKLLADPTPLVWRGRGDCSNCTSRVGREPAEGIVCRQVTVDGDKGESGVSLISREQESGIEYGRKLPGRTLPHHTISVGIAATEKRLTPVRLGRCQPYMSVEWDDGITGTILRIKVKCLELARPPKWCTGDLMAPDDPLLGPQ